MDVGRRKNMAGVKRIAILIEQGFDDAEFGELLKTAADLGLACVIGSSPNTTYRGRDGRLDILAITSAGQIRAEDFDAVLTPGGYAPDEMRLCQDMVDLVKRAHHLGKVIVAVSHGPQLLISAGILRGRRATSSPSIAIDLENAGASWVRGPVVRDGNIISVCGLDGLALLGAVLKRALEGGRDEDASGPARARSQVAGKA